MPKNGDLLYRTYLALKVEGNNNLSDVVPLAYSLIDYIDLFIGGQRIDRHYGSWLRIWHELNVTSEKQLALSDMVGIHSTSNSKLLHIPLRFWFNNNIGTALPLLALQYNDVKIDIKFNNPDEVNVYSEYIIIIQVLLCRILPLIFLKCKSYANTYILIEERPSAYCLWS